MFGFDYKKSKVKTLLIAFFDKKGITHKEFVSAGQTINAAFFRSVSRIWLLGEGGGVWPLPLFLRGQFLLNYNNFVHSEISEHMAVFKKNICKLFKYLGPIEFL